MCLSYWLGILNHLRHGRAMESTMAWSWTAGEWNLVRLALAHAVYAKVRKEAPYAPMSAPLGPGNVLLRSFDRSYVGAGVPATIDVNTVLESIRVRDGTRDQNRFSGPLPAFGKSPAIVPKRGGLYCSEDIHAAIAELLHYADPNLSRHVIARSSRLPALMKRCFVSLRAIGELDVVALDSSSEAMLPFFDRIQRDPDVNKALIAAGYKELFQAIYAPQDYSAARGLGLGLESNGEIDGVQLISARDYRAETGRHDVFRTGDNVMLFGADGKIAHDKVRVEALHLVDPVPGSTELSIVHYERSGAVFIKTTTTRMVP